MQRLYSSGRVGHLTFHHVRPNHSFKRTASPPLNSNVRRRIRARTHPHLSENRLRMDHTRSSVFSLLRGPLLFTPQGWIVLANSISCWSLIGASWLIHAPIHFAEMENRTALLLGAWPIVVFLFYVRLCMPHFQTSWVQTVLLGISAASLPAFEAFKLWSGTA